MLVRRSASLLVAALLLAACGSRLDAETRAAAAGAGGAGPATNGLAVGTSTTTTTAPASTAVAAAAPADPTGGAPADAAAGACVPSGASEVGVTETSISLGAVGTISGPVPGLGQSMMNGANAYFQFLNATQGGICGRAVELETGDDRLDTGVNRSEHARLAPNVLGFVGAWSVTDDGGAEVLGGTNIPDVTLSLSDARRALPNNFSPNPIRPGESGATTVMRHFQQAYGVRTAAVVWGAQATARNSALAFVEELESMGVDVVVQREVAITETNYVPVAQEIENAGAEMLMTALEITGIARLAQAFQQVGYLPRVPYYGAQTYGDRFLELAGSAANGTLLGITHPIVEEAGARPEIATFVEWYQRVNPGQEIDFFAFQGWSAAVMMADAILAAGPSPTRDAVVQALSTFTTFDAHGLVAPIDPAGKGSSPCFMIVTVQNEQWQRVHPEGGGFACP